MVRRIRAAVVIVLVTGLVGAAIVVGASGGFPATRPRLLSGAAWLASVQVGQLTLLDGSSAEVAAQVPVAEPGERLDVVQQAATGYAVNRSTGTIRRVDGATFDVTDPASPLPSAGDGLRAFAGNGTLYALDVARGVLTDADPLTLAPRGNPVPLAAQIAGQSAVLDSAGRLWLLDAAHGDLVWLDHGRRHTRAGVAGPGAGLLVLAGDSPVVVDTRVGTATAFDATDGSTRGRVSLSLRTDDTVAVSGSPHADRIYVVAARGVVEVCPLTAAACPTAIPLGTGGQVDLGAPVETGGRLFVPDYTSGRVWIVDLDRDRVVAQPEVLTPKTRFQLLTRDGVVFFNDPDSARAGVIRLDGGVRRIAKYTNPDASPSNGTGGPAPSAAPSTSPPRPDTPKKPPTTTPPTTPPTTVPPTVPPTTPPPSLSVSIALFPKAPLVGDTVAAQAVNTNPGGPAPSSARWDFGDGATATGTRTSHTWTAARTYQVSVRATFPDGRTALASQSVTVTAPPVLHVQTPVNGSISGGGINCGSACDLTLKPGQRVTLNANPDSGFGLLRWGGDCSGTGSSCTVTMNGNRTVSATFAKRPTLTVDEPFDGTVTGNGINCPPTCSMTYSPNQTIRLTAVPDSGAMFLGWGGACSGSGTAKTCRLTMNGDKNVSANFGIPDPCPPVCAQQGSQPNGAQPNGIRPQTGGSGAVFLILPVTGRVRRRARSASATSA